MTRAAGNSATLESTPLLHLLVSMAERKISGTLSYETPERATGAVVFRQGTPRKASAIAPQSRLSDLLIEFGWLDLQAAAETYAMAVRQGEPHGKVLLDCQLVDEAGLKRVLRQQLVRKLDWLAKRSPMTLVGVHEGVDLLTSVPFGPDDIGCLSIIWELALSHVDEANKRSVLSRVSRGPLKLHPASAPQLFGFGDEEMSLIERLRHVSMDLGSLFYQIDFPRKRAEALLYVLVLTRQLDLGDGRVPLGAVTVDQVSPGAERSKGQASGEYSIPPMRRGEFNDPNVPVGAREAEARGAARQLSYDLHQLAARAGEVDHYALLGVARDAPLAVIRNAFTSLTRRYHPDRLPDELSKLRPLAVQLLAHLMSAYRELGDERQRAHYDRSIPPPSSGADRQRLAKRALSAEALRRAEQFLRNDRLLLAEAEAARALELDPENAKCIALHAWIRSLIPNTSASLDEILVRLTQALDLDPVSVDTRYYRSEILKRLNRLDEAVGEWRLIIELHPTHIEAQRELRLWEMRRSSMRPPKQSRSGTHPQVSMNPPAPGLFGRLFRSSR
ncbi:MAG TPA: J domain-containing protein [Polyangiaceae bacterium]